MDIILWIISGIGVSLFLTLVMKISYPFILMDIVMGVFGALVGGFAQGLAGTIFVEFNRYSFLLSLVGASIFVWANKRFA